MLHAGDIICEGFVKPLKGATPLDASKAATAPTEAEWEHPETETVGSMHFYNAVSRMGLCYGPQFRMVQKLSAAADTAAQLRWPPLPPRTPLPFRLPALGLLATSQFSAATHLYVTFSAQPTGHRLAD